MGLLALLFGCKSRGPFEKKRGVWYYREEPLTTVDARSLQPLSDHYAKDAAHVYYADTYRDGKEYFTKRHARLTTLDGADVATFRYLDQGYARDKSRVYFEGERFAVRDPETFAVLDYGFAKDRLTGYYHQEPVPGSDGQTFGFVDNHYSKDATNAFYSWLEPGTDGAPPARHSTRVDGAHANSFSALESGYATDTKRVYYKGALIPDADPLTFKMAAAPNDSSDAADAKTRYREGKRVSGAARDSARTR